jgi:hypothetical protein
MTFTVTDQFGNKTTIPVTVTVASSQAGEIAIFRQSPPVYGQGVWAFDVNANFQFDGGVDTFRVFGLPGDIPVAGDWYGTGTTTIGVFRNGTWVLDLNNNGVWDGTAAGKDGVFSFGLPGDMPVVGDWNGDGRTKFGVFRCPSSGTGQCQFILDYAGKMAFDSATAKFFTYGLPGDKPVAGRWNATTVVDQIGVFRCNFNGGNTCIWVVNSTGTGAFSSADQVYFYGLNGDYPIVGDWNGSGQKRIGVFRNGTIVLNINGTGQFGATDFIGSFGLAGDIPVVGTWTNGLTQ